MSFTLWTANLRTLRLEDMDSPGLLFLTSRLNLVGCFFHGPSYGQLRLFWVGNFAAAPYQITRHSC